MEAKRVYGMRTRPGRFLVLFYSYNLYYKCIYMWFINVDVYVVCPPPAMPVYFIKNGYPRRPERARPQAGKLLEPAPKLLERGNGRRCTQSAAAAAWPAAMGPPPTPAPAPPASCLIGSGSCAGWQGSPTGVHTFGYGCSFHLALFLVHVLGSGRWHRRDERGGG